MGWYAADFWQRFQQMGFLWQSTPFAPRCWRQEAVRTSMSRTSRPPDGARVSQWLMSCWCQLQWIWNWRCMKVNVCLFAFDCMLLNGKPLVKDSSSFQSKVEQSIQKPLTDVPFYMLWYTFLETINLLNLAILVAVAMVRSHWKFVASSFGRCWLQKRGRQPALPIKDRWKHTCRCEMNMWGFPKMVVPPKTPPKLSFLVGTPMVIRYHRFRKPPCSEQMCWKRGDLCRSQELWWHQWRRDPGATS